MNFETVDLSIDEGIARLVLDSPDTGNSFGAVFCRELPRIAAELAARSDVRVVLLSARGRFFSVGGDLGLFSADLDRMPAAVLDGTAGLHVGLARLLRLDAPVVACVQGTATGGAVSLLSNCDLVFSAQTARFGAAYSKVGFSVDLGASVGLASRMGIARARRFLLLGETLGADEALAAGLVDFVHPDDTVEDAALQAAVALAAGPTRAYGEMRRLLSRALAVPFEAQLEDEAQALARVAGTNDAREGITAFVAKRSPEFHGS